MEYLDIVLAIIIQAMYLTTAIVLGDSLVSLHRSKRSTNEVESIERATRKFEKAFAIGLRRVNSKYNTFFIGNKMPHFSNGMAHLHYFLITRDYKENLYTPRQLFVKLKEDLRDYNLGLVRRYTAVKEVTRLTAALVKQLDELEDYCERLGGGFKQDCSKASINLRILLNNIDEDILTIENKDILSPYYQYEVSRDNSFNPIHSYLKKYEVC